MIVAAGLLLLLLVLTGVLLAPPLVRRPRRTVEQPASPTPLGAPVGPFERWEAERKGQELLRRLLTDEEYAQLQRDGYLAVASPSVAGRVYRVPRRRGFVERHEDGGEPLRLCLVPDRWLPDADIVLMHKFLIEADEALYLQRANHLGPGAESASASPSPADLAVASGVRVASRPCRRA